MTWHRVAEAGEIKPGKPKILSVAGRSIGVFFETDRYFAILNYCPHFGAPVCLGHVFGAVTSEQPGQQSLDTSRPILRCPWHRWEFDMETGAALTPIKQRIKTYPIHVEDNGENQDCETECGDPKDRVETFGVKIDAGSIWVKI